MTQNWQEEQHGENRHPEVMKDFWKYQNSGNAYGKNKYEHENVKKCIGPGREKFSPVGKSFKKWIRQRQIHQHGKMQKMLFPHNQEILQHIIMPDACGEEQHHQRLPSR
jgi:hypothetical protein